MDRRPLGDSGFRPLTDDHFEELERLGNVKFSHEIRASLNERLERLCSVEGDGLVHRERRAASRMLAGLAGDIARVQIRLNGMRDTRLAAWELFPIDSMGRFSTKHLSGAVLGQPYSQAAMMAMLQTVRRWAEQRAKSLEPKRGRKGRHPNLWLEYFIVLIAEAYTAAGGTVSASYQETMQRRQTPFLRVLRAVHRHLPAKRQAKTERRKKSEYDWALDERAACAIGVWGEWKVR